MSRPEISTAPIGREGEPLVTIDGFAPDADALRAAALTARFTPAGEHYPGVRAPLPDGWLRARMPTIASAIGRAFGRCRRVQVIDAAFSIVTTPPVELSVKQRLPHVDAWARERVAMVHYLDPAGGDGTAFFRHRSTGYETVDATRARAYHAALETDLREHGEPAPVYLNADTPLFQRIAAADARWNRALLYRSVLLHSGAIAADAVLSPDPAKGRLTVTAFFAVD